MGFFKSKSLSGLMDPGGLFGGNKGKTADQTYANMLTGGFSSLIGLNKNNALNQYLNNSSFLGESKNQRDERINQMGTNYSGNFPTQNYEYVQTEFNPNQFSSYNGLIKNKGSY